LKHEEEESQEAAQNAKDALARAISDVRNSKGIEPEYRAQIVQQLKVAQARYAEASEYEREARDSLELMSMMGVMAGFMTHEFEKAVGTLADAAQIVRELARRDPALKSKADRLAVMESALAHYMDYMRIFIGRARVPRPQQFKACAQVQLVVNTLKAVSDAHDVHVQVDISPSLPGPMIPIAAYHGIVVNLVSNALKALVPKRSDEQRKVRIFATTEGTKHVLVCADNGIGIPDYLRDRIWDPLYSTTTGADEDNPLASGLGLGLSLVRQVVKKLRGKIELLDDPPPDFVTAFRVQLPLTNKN
jgi:signal transduction histidine kinase